MGRIVYSVVATLPDPRMLDEYVAWLTGGHVDGVIEGGALSGEVVRLDGEGLRVESRYVFADRAAFERYEREFAPALRADGAARFGNAGVVFERRVGEVM